MADVIHACVHGCVLRGNRIAHSTAPRAGAYFSTLLRRCIIADVRIERVAKQPEQHRTEPGSESRKMSDSS